MSTFRTQRPKDKTWYDEKGTPIPYNRTTKLERFIESGSGKIVKKAMSVNQNLTALKEELRVFCDEIFLKSMIENDTNEVPKGNFTKYNFDRSIKVEVDIKDRIEFDDLTIMACKTKFEEFLADKVHSNNDYVKQMVLDAFETTRGKLDVKKVMSLLRYESKIPDPRFQSALKSLKDSIRRPSSKAYFRVSVRNENGGYEQIQLNFSAI